ncbi:MAG: hypothetical protein IJR03_03595 [Bacteroidales bacterium]|nr:hypothetical protein [Bacteroidales bacterium]
MRREILTSVIQYIVLVFFQVLILDKISLFGIATPMIYVLFILNLPMNTSRWLTLLASFFIGISIDIFSGQTGIHSFSCTFIGFIRPYLLTMYSTGPIENAVQRPTLSRLGFSHYLSYSFVLVFVHHFLCFLIGIFSFSEFFHTFLRLIVSVVATMIIILITELIFFRSKD